MSKNNNKGECVMKNLDIKMQNAMIENEKTDAIALKNLGFKCLEDFINYHGNKK